MLRVIKKKRSFISSYRFPSPAVRKIKTALLCAAALLTPVSFADGAQVRPAPALFRTGILPDLPAELFVIGDFPPVAPLKVASTPPLAVRFSGKQPPAVITGSPVAAAAPTAGRDDFCLSRQVFFELGSRELREREISSLLAHLEACGISRQEPLVVTGETCDLGTAETNERLARARARQVAAALKDAGYSVVTATGRPGAAAEIDPEARHLWRRAVILVGGEMVP